MYQVFLSEWQPIAGRMDTSVIWECEDAKEAYEYVRRKIWETEP